MAVQRAGADASVQPEELRDFLADKRPDLAEFLDDDKWLAQLSYLSDIFGEMNKLNRAMQGANINTVVQHERVEAFKRKLHCGKPVSPPESVTCLSTPMHLLQTDT